MWTLRLAKLRQLEEVTAVREIASLIDLLRVRCADDNSHEDGADRAAAIRELSTALSKLEKINAIDFQPSKAAGEADLDFSDTFYDVLFLAQDCGLRPQHIFGLADVSAGPHVDFVLTRFASMQQLAPCFSELKSFVVNLGDIDGEKEFARGRNLMQSLTDLKLDFPPRSAEVMREMGRGRSSPTS